MPEVLSVKVLEFYAVIFVKKLVIFPRIFKSKEHILLFFILFYNFESSSLEKAEDVSAILHTFLQLWGLSLNKVEDVKASSYFSTALGAQV